MPTQKQQALLAANLAMYSFPFMLAHSCRVMAQVVPRGFAQLRQSWVACVITRKLNRLELVN